MTVVVKRQILASQISYKRSELNEECLYVDLQNFFQRLKEKVLKELEEYWNPEFMFQGHMDLILSPIFESQKEYYTILHKHIKKEYNFGKSHGKRLVGYARKNAKKYTLIGADKSDYSKLPLSSIIKKDELFGTSEFSRQKLYQQSFTASENTMNRVDSSINQILRDGYAEGWGQNKVAGDLTHRFDQLKDWEAKRIARTEIHNAHNMGIMQSYQDLDVSYTQWGAAHDSRVRDSHVDLDGEIIPFGATYSNGLAYPGDTNGPIDEWINCRCVNMPFIIPDGYIAPPGMVPFRESDLIPTLDYWNQEDLISIATDDALSQMQKKSSSFDLDIINPELIESNFSIPVEDLSEFGITEKGMETIQRYTKRRIGSDIEYGVSFNEKTGKFLSKEFPGDNNDIVMLKPNGKYSTIHYHTDSGFRPTSSGDFYEFLNSKNERVGINISRKESWFIKNERKFSANEINNITLDIAKIEQKQLTKLTDEYNKRLFKINNIKDPVKRNSAKKDFEKYVANTFLDKHNKELGEEILKYTSNIDGLKVKRVMHTEINPKLIKTISKKELKVDKRTLSGIKKYSTPIKNKGYDKYALSGAEETQLKELQTLKKKGDTLKFRDRKKLDLLENQSEFNKLHAKYIKNGKLSAKDAERYKKLNNDSQIQKKFKLDLIEDTLKLEGKTKKIVVNLPVREPSKFDELLEIMSRTSIYDSTYNKTYINFTHKSKTKIDMLVKLQKLNDTQLRLVKKWSGAANRDMNDFLKGLLVRIESGEFENINQLNDYVDDLIHLIDNLPKDKCISEDTLLYRGICFENMSEKEILAFFKKGKPKRLKTFTSTSYDLDTADQFAEYGYGEGYIIRVHAPKGTKGVAINEDISSAYEEYEYLLSPNQKFKTLNIDEKNHIIDILLV